MAGSTQDVQNDAQEALENDDKFVALVKALSGPSRRERQSAGASLAFISLSHPELLLPCVDAVIDALNRPEAQTRWECLDILTKLVDLDSRACDKALPGAESALFDEDSGIVRLAAVRFLCKLGATTAHRSERVWPLLDEAIQCYHGDFEFPDMLAAVVDFSSGSLSDTVKSELADRMAFDAKSGKGGFGKRARQILENVQG